ncbi:MAG: ABC transporter permease [Lentisphaerae bacterium]|nr:ABC transporter permease [Lentisphaerota bacterium]
MNGNDWFLLKQMILRNIQLRFKGSFLGWIWSFLIPLLMLTVYTIVFGNFFKSRWGVDMGENKMIFALALFSGMTFYNIFGESVSIATSSVIGNVNYVKKVRFPLIFLPVSQVISTSLLALPSVILLFGCVIIFLHHVSFNWLLLPLTLFPLILFSAGVSCFVASLGVYFRDIQYLITIILQMLFFLSPVFYRLQNLPEKFQKLLNYNPMVWFIELNRGVVFSGCDKVDYSLPSFSQWAISYALGTAAFILGFIWFNKTKRGFSDVL